MPYADLREFIARPERENDLVRITEEVDSNLEAGAIMRRSNELGAAAQLFENVKGYPERRLFGGTLSTMKRLALQSPRILGCSERQSFFLFGMRRVGKRTWAKQVFPNAPRRYLLEGLLRSYLCNPRLHGGATGA